MGLFVSDIRYAWRGLRRAPGFAAAAIATLALGMGATTAIFSVVRSVLLAPLPYAEPQRRVTLWTRWTSFDKTWVADGEVDDFRRLCPSLESVAAWDPKRANLTDPAGGDPVRVGVGSIEWNTFQTLGARPLLGRAFTPEEDRPGGAPVAVLGWSLWQSRYGGDPAIPGRSIRVDGISRRVVGVMPRGFALPTDFTADAAEPTALWIPLQLDPKERTHGSHNYYAAGLLRRGASAARATAEMKAVMAARTREGVYPAPMRFEAFAVPVEEEVRGGARRALLLVFGAVGFLMVMACANVANLLLARAEGRHREISIRAAIGAGKWRLVRQLLTESLLLASLAGTVGMALAWGAIRVITARGRVAAGLPALVPIGLDWRMLLFGAALTVATTLAFGLAPAFATLRLDLSQALRDSSAASTGGLRGISLRRGLAAAQMALAVVLLLGAGLMVRTLDALLGIDLGFDPRHVLTLRLRPDEVAYPKATQVTAVYRTIVDRVREIPGVRAAGLVRSLPLAASIGDRGLEVEDYVPPPGGHAKGDWQVVSDGALEALGERVVEGRPLAGSDIAESQPVVLVNQTFVRTYWPDGRALGRQIRMRSDRMNRPYMTVVGVVRDERHNGITGVIKEKFYVPHAQFSVSTGTTPRDMTLVVRAAGDPAGLAAPVRAAIRAVDPGLPVADVRSMESVVDASVATPRLTASLLAVFAAIALVLASVGVAGVLAYLVSRRRREIGIRMALGATRGRVLALVIRRGVAWACVGIAAGLAASFGLTRLMSGLLYGVAPRDPGTFVAVAAILLSVAVIASAVPAFRASRVDPLEALKTD